jgi:acetyltransferase
MGPHYLDRFFTPQAIAVFGASERENAVGTRVYNNLLESGFSGPIYPINPKYTTLNDHDCYPDIQSIKQPIDLAVIATPAPTVPEILHTCGEHGVRAAIVISAGFSEGDGKGLAYERAALDIARQYQMRLLGPNCLGLIRPSIGMNATFSKNSAQPGNLALVSQSGALCTAILDWAVEHDIGFSTIVSLGDAADIDFGDILDYLSQDAQTQSILLYVEGIRNARRFISGLRIAARMKPVIVIKSGRHEEGSRAATTHTGALIGSDNVFDAALQRAGVVRAQTIEQLFAAAQLLTTQQRVSGNRLAIVTNGGGPGVMATDRAVDLGVKLAELSSDTISNLDKILPAHWSHQNPVDVLGDASPERYEAAVSACLADENVDGVLVMLTPQAMTDVTSCAEAVIASHKGQSKPVLVCWMGEKLVAEANKLFTQNHIPHFASPESSVEAFAYLATYYQNQQLLMQVPGPRAKHSEPDKEGAELIIDSVLSENRTVLTITESKALLHAFDIPFTRSIECHTANEALVAAESLGFPIAMKIHSPDISHKSDVGGVRLNIGSAQLIRHTYHQLVEEVGHKYPDANISGVTIEPMYISPHGRELLIGVSRDPVFGPVITFGSGGKQVEILRDSAVALPPLNTFLIEQIINQTKVASLLKDFRDMPAIKMSALVRVLRRVSEMVCELPQIQALDINPLIADKNGVMALDARIVVGKQAPSHDHYSHMAIHPYPGHLESQFQLADGTTITVRPIRPEDAEIEQSFVRKLSAKSKYFRFMRSVNELTQEMLVRFTQLDYHRELALIGVVEQNGEEVEVGVSRYAMNPDGKSCEFAVIVADEWQRKGIGSHLMDTLMDAARQRGFQTMDGEILADNHNMLGLVKSLGFQIHTSPDDPTVKVAERRL